MEITYFLKAQQNVSKHTVVGKITAPKDVHILIQGTYDSVILQGKRDFAGVIKDLQTKVTTLN